MSIKLDELRKIISEVIAEGNPYNPIQTMPAAQQPSPGEQGIRSTYHMGTHGSVGDPRDDEDLEGISDSDKAALFDALMQNVKILLENWRERDPQTTAGSYFHDVLHLVKSYDPEYFPPSDDPAAMPDDAIDPLSGIGE
jgi:hypothetical protein